MFKARIFTTGEIVEAQDVLEGKYDRNENFVDVEEDFKVSFVRKAKGDDGRPYFRFYYSLEDYRRLFPESADKYEILWKQRHYQETKWHRDWEDKFRPFAKVEKRIKNEETGKYKQADAYYEETSTCIEFQHSFIDYDFEERNKFYKELNINTIWLYDLTHLDVKQADDGVYQILEDNAKGFFRIAENPENLENSFVFVQAKDGLIYQVEELFRKTIENESNLKSTIRCFYPVSINTTSEFIENVKNDVFKKQRKQMRQAVNPLPEEQAINNEYTDLYSLWKPGFIWMTVECKNNPIPLFIREYPFYKGKMETKGFFIPPTIIGRTYIVEENIIKPRNAEFYIDGKMANKPIWKLLNAQIRVSNI